MKRFGLLLLVVLGGCVPFQRYNAALLNDVTDSLGIISVPAGRVVLTPPAPLERVVLVINGDDARTGDAACGIEEGVIICEWTELPGAVTVDASAVDAVVTASYRVRGQSSTRHEVYGWL